MLLLSVNSTAGITIDALEPRLSKARRGGGGRQKIVSSVITFIL
jgi:hypothetical protein